MHCGHASDMYPVAELRMPAGLVGYHQDLTIGLAKTTVRGPATSDAYVVVSFKQGSFADKSQLDFMRQTRAWTQTSAVERWRRLVMDPHAATDVDALTETVESVLDFIAEFGPGMLELSGLRPMAVKCEHLATLLRATSSWRDEIPGWDEALGVARAAVEIAGLDPEDVLFGMV